MERNVSVFSEEKEEGGKRGRRRRRRSVVFQRLGRQVAAPALCLPGPQDQQVTHPKQAHTPSHTHFKTGSLSHTHTLRLAHSEELTTKQILFLFIHAELVNILYLKKIKHYHHFLKKVMLFI